MANGPGDPATSQTLHSSTPEQATRSREVYFAKAALRRRSAFPLCVPVGPAARGLYRTLERL